MTDTQSTECYTPPGSPVVTGPTCDGSMTLDQSDLGTPTLIYTPSPLRHEPAHYTPEKPCRPEELNLATLLGTVPGNSGGSSDSDRGSFQVSDFEESEEEECWTPDEEYSVSDWLDSESESICRENFLVDQNWNLGLWHCPWRGRRASQNCCISCDLEHADDPIDSQLPGTDDVVESDLASQIATDDEEGGANI